MRCRIRDKLGDRSGQSLVELALVLPLLTLLLVGVVDLSRAIQAHNSIVNMSREGANLASRSSLMQQENGPQLIMNSLANTTQSLPMTSNGMMYITEVQGVGGVPTIKSQVGWRQNGNGPPSGIVPASLGSTLGSIRVNDGDTIWIFEVFYKYQSLFVQSYAPQLHSVAIFSGGSN